MNNPGLAAGLARRSCRRRKDEPAEPRPFQHSEFSTHHSSFSISLVRRHLIGIIAIASLLAAAALWMWPPEATWRATVHAGLVKGGVLSAIVWLAYGDVRSIPGWLWSILLGILVVVAVRPKMVLFAIPIIIALAILRPRLPRGG